MTWTIYRTPNDSFVNDGTFDKAPLVRADKKGEIEDITASLDAVQVTIRTAERSVLLPPQRASKKQAADFVRNAQAYINGDLKKVAGALKVTSKRIENALKDHKAKRRTINKKLVPMITGLKAACDAYAASIDRKTLVTRLPRLAEAAMAAEEAQVLRMVGPVSKTFRSCAAKGHAEINSSARLMRNWRDDMPDAHEGIRGKVGELLRKCARDMSQNVVNLNKAVSRGIEIPGFEARDYTTIPKLAKSLTPIANSQSGDQITRDMGKAELLHLIRTMKAHANLYDQIASHLPS